MINNLSKELSRTIWALRLMKRLFIIALLFGILSRKQLKRGGRVRLDSLLRRRVFRKNCPFRVSPSMRILGNEEELL